MRGFNKTFRWVFLTLAFAITIDTYANESDQPEVVKNVINAFQSDKSALRKLAAKYMSERIDFLDVSYLEPNGNNNENGFLLSYKWNIESNDQWVGVKDKRFGMRRTSYGLDIDGKYAFGDAVNNSDLSTISAKFSMERGDFGEIDPDARENSIPFQDCLKELEERFPQPDDEEDDLAWSQYRIDSEDFENSCWTNNGIDMIIKDDESAYIYGIDFHAKLEGNQDFDDSNLVYGLSGVLAMQPSIQARKLNIFDFPFRLMRENVSNNSNYVAPWPSIKLDIDRVDASDNEMREALTTDTKFTRATAEIAFQTILASFKSEPVRFNISYRYFHEFSAPVAIEAVGMDSFDYVAMSLRFPARLLPIIESKEYEFFISYTNGQLPFDLQSEQVFEVGIATNISQLAKLFGKH